MANRLFAPVLVRLWFPVVPLRNSWYRRLGTIKRSMMNFWSCTPTPSTTNLSKRATVRAKLGSSDEMRHLPRTVMKEASFKNEIVILPAFFWDDGSCDLPPLTNTQSLRRVFWHPLSRSSKIDTQIFPSQNKGAHQDWM